MLLFLYGPDTFRSRQYLRESVQKFKTQRDPQGYNVVFLDGQKEKMGKIIGEMTAAPFLAERRMVIIDNILASSDKELLQALIERIKAKKIPESNVVIFWQGELLSKVKEAKELQALLVKEKYAQEFPLLSGVKLQAWVAKTVQEQSGVIESPALEYLCQNAGADTWLLSSTINQLLAFKNKTSITASDVKLFIEEKVDDNVFNMIEAVASGNRKQAFKLLEQQRRQGEEDAKIFGLFIWQFRILVEITDMLEREPGITSDTIARETGLHPFVAKKNLPLAKKYSLAKLQSVYQKLLDIDIKTKTGQGDQSLLIDVFVAEI